MKTLLLIDGHAIIHRAFHALPDTMQSSNGTPTNAIYGFFMMLQKVLTEFKPTHLAVCFDTPKPTFRKELFNDYQSKRPPMDNTLKVQIPEIKTLLTNGGVPCLEMPGFEADDVIGTVAEQQKTSFDRVLILTGDRDLLQLTDDTVYVISPKMGVTSFILFTPDEVKLKYGMEAIRIPDYKSLAGDSSDNYNTARGIGPKTAQKLLGEFTTVENLFDHVDEVENEKWKTILKENKDTILLFKKIATIVRDVDIHPEHADMEFDGFDKEMQTDLKRLELYSLMKKLYNNVEPEKKLVPPKKKKEPNKDQIDMF